jgi:hypothetical protein
MTIGGRASDGDAPGVRSAAPALPSSATLRHRRRFFRHVLTYVVGNLVLLVVWLVVGMTTGSWFFWPVFVLAAWGLLLDAHAWLAYGRPGIGRAADR